MKHSLAILILSFNLISCTPQTYFNQTIENLGFIAYRVPLDAVGAGTIVKGKAANMVVYADPESCLPSVHDGLPTKIRWEAETDLPQELREVSFNFSSDLTFFGSTGNPLFKFKTGIQAIKKVELKFTDARIEFINEIKFWEHFKEGMHGSCRKAFLKYPIFWKALKVGKMEFVFKNEAGGVINLSADKIEDMVDFAVDANWSIKNNYILTIDSPKYIGFLAAMLDQEALANEDATKFSAKLDKKGNYIWEEGAAKLLREDMALRNEKPL